LENSSSAAPVLDAERQADARRYARRQRWFSLLDYLLAGIMLLVLLASGLLRHLAGFLDLPQALAAVVYFLCLMLGYALITAPLDYYTGYILPWRYGLSRQTPADWLADHLKAGALGLLLGSALVAVAYWLLSATPRLWWLWGWVAVIIISLVLSVLAPIAILPLFFKTSPLPEGELKERLQKLAQEAGIRIGGIYTAEFSAKSTTANAALMGAGKTRRIILSDTLLDKYAPAEISVIISHEMGHQRHRDMLRLFVFQSAVLLISFYLSSLLFRALLDSFGFSGVSDPATLPLLILIFGLMGLVMTPLTASFTRLVESQADRFALELTGDPDAFVNSMARLTGQNLSDASPPRWVEILLDDHPSYRQRVAMAQKYKAKQST